MIVEEKKCKRRAFTQEEIAQMSNIEKEDREAKLKLIEDFNVEAKRQNNKYRIVLRFNKFLHLSVWWCPFWFNPNSKQIYRSSFYDKDSEKLDSFRNYEFEFIFGIERKLYYRVKSIIDRIPQKWKIEIKEEKK